MGWACVIAETSAICHVVGIDFAIAGANAVAGGNKQRRIIRERSGGHAVYAIRCHTCALESIATLKLKGYSEGISHSSAVDECLEIIHCRLLRVVGKHRYIPNHFGDVA